MLSIRSCHGQIPKAFLLNPSSFFLRLLHSSTSPSADLQPHFMVDYLIDSLGFSKQEAISASTKSPEMLEEKLVDVEREFGIMRGSPMFSYGLSAICSQSKLNLQKKYEMFKSFGWSDLDICMIGKSQPVCFTLSEERLSKGLNFFMEELGDAPSALATRGRLLTYSLEKRVKPRYQVFKVLKEKGAIKCKFLTVLGLSDVNFVKRIVQRHKEAIPDHLYDSFTNKLKC